MIKIQFLATKKMRQLFVLGTKCSNGTHTLTIFELHLSGSYNNLIMSCILNSYYLLGVVTLSCNIFLNSHYLLVSLLVYICSLNSHNT